MTASSLLAMAQEAAESTGNQRLLGWLLVGAAVFDLLLAVFLAVARPNPDPRARTVLPLALGVGALVMAGLGVAFLTGALGG